MDALYPSQADFQARAGARRPDYARARSTRQLLGNALRIYGRYFFRLLIIAALPTLPLEIWFAWAGGDELMAAMVWLSVFGLAAVAIAVSDVCRCNQPGIFRTYRRLLRKRFLFVAVNSLVAILATYAVGIAIFLASAAAVGLSVAALKPRFGPVAEPVVIVLSITIASFVFLRFLFAFVFVPVISAIEEKPGILKPLRRSFVLTRHNLGRIIFFLAALMILMSLVITGAAMLEMYAKPLKDSFVFRTATVAVYRLCYPFFAIALILIYFDLRTQKEGVSRQLLMQELDDD